MLGQVFAIVAAIGIGAAGIQTYRLNLANAEAVRTDIELRACGARLTNLIEDLESDNAVDRLPDSALVDVPDHWLRPSAD